MPGWSEVLPEAEIRKLAIYIADLRADISRWDMPLAILEGTVANELHDFRIEAFASGSAWKIYSIAPLPDGGFLLTEKRRGVRIVSADGVVLPAVEGTPKVDLNDDPNGPGPIGRTGWAGSWRSRRTRITSATAGSTCSTEIAAPTATRSPTAAGSMSRLVRGRIEDGRWVDEETLWDVGVERYTWRTDMAAGGRICFDDDGHVFISVGFKGLSTSHGIQDLGEPYGKIHRMYDDGGVPADNPFVDVPGAWPTTWTYGHRAPEGLEFNRRTGQLWSTEMGPRGGDEINLLLPGRNYGWPLTSKGVDYDGTPVEYGKELGITFDLADIEQPVVDLTPAPAVSSFVFYEGDAFPAWRGQMLVGSLRAADLFRVRIDGDRFVEKETLIEDLARVRDIEVGVDGLVYLLLEHAAGWTIARLVPAVAG